MFGTAPNIPMVLANDNFWGYTSDVIYKYGVTWLEAAIVQPCFTSILVCYVEGDYGHLIGEELHQQKFRTKVRGTAHSSHMPWEDVLEELQRHCMSKDAAEVLPRRPECLKYILRVQLRVGGKNLERALRRLTVRPFVLLELLYFLIDHNHEVFHGHGTAQALRQKMQAAVAQNYPVDKDTAHLPVEEQTWQVPSNLLLDAGESAGNRRRTFMKEKNATPGAGGYDAEQIFANLRPAAVTQTMSAQAASDPASMRTGAVVAHGRLHVKTDKALVEQWHPRYFSQILPFEIPYMVSGPDFSFYQKNLRWRRNDFGDHAEAPWVSPAQWEAGFARRAEAQCRHSWTALPVIRSVTHKYKVETAGMLLAAPFSQRRNEAQDMHAKAWIQRAKKLSQTLWEGHQRIGNLRIPINGDTTRLPHAEGLTAQEKRMARAVSFKARHFPGTQQVRQLMGHCHFGARINHGDCLFFTISPNENQSALVLKVSRHRKADPFMRYKDAPWQQLCGVDYPDMASKRRRKAGSSGAASHCIDDHTASDHEIVVELPEYDIRREVAAGDPLAVVETHRLNVCLRLAWLLGVRMCPSCPRCNDDPWGCQDIYGSNMRPTGGVIGGVETVEIGNEHQGHGTPHGHGQAHVVCIYQFGTLREIAEKIRVAWDEHKDQTLVHAMRAFHEWFHVEKPLDMDLHQRYQSVAEQGLFKGFADETHAPLAQTQAYMQEDADDLTKPTLAKAYDEPDELMALEAEGRKWKQQYLRDAQFVFSRVQHHVHKKDKDGNYVPLNACARKQHRRSKKLQIKCKCKADFPKDNVITTQTVLICQGLAKKFKLRVSGRRNAYGMWQGCRMEAWQSGTTPAFAVHFRSNSHTMPNYRLPPVAATHEDSLCTSRVCKERAHQLMQTMDLRKISKLQQRVQREATGYYCGYTFKGQVVGRKYLLQASRAYDYMEPELADKTEGQRMHRMTNKLFVDMQHRCVARPAAEEWTLAAYQHQQDVTNSEFIRTFRSVQFPGGQYCSGITPQNNATC